MFKSKALKAGIFSAALTVVLAGCAQEPDEGAVGNANNDGGANDNAANGEDGNNNGDEAAGGGEGGDLVIATLSDANMLDPHSASDIPSGQANSNIFETLTKYDTDMELEPLLAEEWEAVEEDVWEFKLVEGVTFHDGSEFNADVVKMNIERILDPELASPRAILVDIIDEVIVVDDHTVQFRTEDPFAPLPAHLAHYSISMISPEVIEEDYARVEDGDQYGQYINENPIGTGAFKFESWDTGDQLVMVKNEDYWGEPAHLDSVTLKVVPEDLTRVGELETGAAHVIDPLTPSDMSQVENSEGIDVYQRSAASITYMGFNMEKEPFDDERVRRAVALALDRASMVDGILEGTGVRAVGPINDTQFGFSENVDAVEQDYEEARALLAEAGYEDGFDTVIWTNDSRERQDIAELAQADLAQIGVNAEINVVEWGAYLDATGAGDHDIFILGLSLGTGDADYPLHMLFHSENAGPQGNRSFMRDEEFDQMLHEARIEQDEDTRLALYEDIVNYLNEQSPMAFLYHPDHIMGVADNVEGFWADPSGLYQLKDIQLNN
ncbi:glutathione ABC transporter substrate-binding protein [Evansella sp. LMS18]|uniref:glutathione ABC transporter substrate-binding protein n=1 Tax=Evansella sp. LMS18 TaxID=2924033 RepID=UPI0020CFF799|nr:glutathione ABC transporter substrate-binding protein [Evansella sp. LMS18]UTR12341.1 glutathione ABC transporter substrate-binding protein [Evansella sp. LMS18]